jgi:hypothetical protein
MTTTEPVTESQYRLERPRDETFFDNHSHAKQALR